MIRAIIAMTAVMIGAFLLLSLISPALAFGTGCVLGALAGIDLWRVYVRGRE